MPHLLDDALLLGADPQEVLLVEHHRAVLVVAVEDRHDGLHPAGERRRAAESDGRQQKQQGAAAARCAAPSRGPRQRAADGRRARTCPP